MENRSLSIQLNRAISIVAVVIMWSCSTSDSPGFATVDHVTITSDTFEDRYTDFLNLTHVTDNLHYRYIFLNSLIDEQVLLQYADDSGFWGHREHREELDKIRDQLLLNTLFESEIEPLIAPPDSVLRTLYTWSKTSLHVQHLFSRTRDGIESIWDRLENGEKWDDIAMDTFQDSVLKNTGGNLGFVQLGDLDPAFENQAYTLSDGEISKPVQTEYGYSIIRVIERETDPFFIESEYQQEKGRLSLLRYNYFKKEWVKSYTDDAVDALNLSIDFEGIRQLEQAWNNRDNRSPESPVTGGDISCIFIGLHDREISLAECMDLLMKLPDIQQHRLQSEAHIGDALKGIFVQKYLLSRADEMNLWDTNNLQPVFDLAKTNYAVKSIVKSIQSPFDREDFTGQKNRFATFRDSLRNQSHIYIDSIALKQFVMEQPT